MTLQLVGAARIPCGVLSQMRPAERRPAYAPAYDATLSPPHPRNLEIVEDSRSSAVLRAKSLFKFKQTDDGGVEVKFKSWLKFDYEFQSEDGTTISLSAKIKTQIAYEQNGDGSFEFKARVKFQLSMLQRTVESSLTPVLDSDALTGEEMSAVSSALQDFGGMVDRLTSQFLDDALVGDDLIVDVVSAFNELTRSVQSGLPKEADARMLPVEEPPLDLSGAAVDSPASPVAVVNQDLPLANIPTVENEIHGDVGVRPDADQPTAQPAGGVDVASDGEPVKGATAAPLDIVGSQAEAEMPAATSSYSAGSLFVELRVKFVQSISALVAVLDSPSDGADTSVMNANIRAHTRLDIRLAAYSQTQAWGENPPGLNVDAEA
jgi:hypothetical protein